MISQSTIWWAGRVLVLAALMAVLASCDSATEPEEEPPVVVILPATAHGQYDEQEYYPGCITGPESPSTISSTCPVLRWSGYDYWALSFGDNRSSMAIHAYDPDGALRNVEERTGARYVYEIDVDEIAETVTFRGQVDRTIMMTWDELRQLR